jgi:hypothetical protein
MIDKPKKERRFLKALGRVGEILIQEVLLKVGSNLIKRIGGKKTLPSILFLFLSISLFAQFPSTGNKQRLGFQTSADGLVWRGSLSDTASIQPVSNQNAWVILDTVNLKLYSFDFTSNVWNALPQGTNIDTASLSNRINLKLNISDTSTMLLPYFKDTDTSLLNLVSRFALKLNISDTAAMLLPYATKEYADTTGRLYARQDYTTGVTTSTLTWTQTDTLIPGGVTFIQVYRNGQILLPSQYTVPTSTSVVISASSFKVNDNYTVIFPRGGGAGSGGGSGSLTSISGGTGIIVSPNPITTTGTVSADLSVLMELTDTSLLNLTSRFATKLNATDTASLSTRIDAKGTGTVTSVGSGFGLLGGTITTTGTLRLDTSTIYARLQDSINVAIGGDTIKILKQEYQPALSSVLTWTITPKFPIQLKAYILVFRNGQLLNNDQYNLTDTNKITIVSTSFKVGANYTVATVSGIGSVGSAQEGNPVYPEAGIALSTGSTWASSITNNSSNWNTAYNDKVNSLAVTGTTTKTITLTQQDGGTVSGNFSDNGTVTSVGMTVPTGLAISGQPITTSGTLALSYASGYSIPTDIKQNEWNTAYNDKINNAAFTGTDTKTLTLTQVDGGTLTPTFTDLQGVTGVTAGTGLTGETITTTGTLAADTNFLVTRFDTSTMLLPYFRDTDTTQLNLTSRFAAKQNTLTNPVTGTGTINYLPKFTTTDSTIGNSTLIDNGTTISTASILSTTNYAALDAGNNTHRFTNTLSGNQTWTPSAGFITSYFNNNVSGGWYYNTSVDNSGFPILSILSTSNDRKKSGITLNSQGTANGTYSPAITFSSLSNSTSYYSAYAAIIGKKTGVGGVSGSDGNWNTGHIEFYGTTQATDVNGGVMLNSPSMTLGLGVGIGYDAPPTIKGRLIVSERIGINQSTPNFTLDVNGTLGVTGATTLSSTLAVQGDITENNNNVMTNLDTVSLSNRIDTKYNSSGGTISGAVTLSTTTATPTGLLGKDGSNVVGTVTTLAQTGLMTRGETTETTGSPSAVFTVTHGLGSNPSAVIITSAGIGGGDKIIFEVYTKSSTTFSVQAWNLDGTEAASKSVKIYWLAIK